mgnify:FL=1
MGKNGWIKNDMKLPEFIRLLPECYEENNCGKIVGVYENWLGTPPDESPVGIRMIKPCSYWLKGLNKFKIFKLENLQTLQDFFINNDYNIEVDISTIRVLPTVTDGEGSYLHKFDQEEKDIIEKLFHSDFVNFGYEKGIYNRNNRHGWVSFS